MNKNVLTPQVKNLRAKIKESGIPQRQLYQTVGVSYGWFRRMIMGDFHEPNAEWMAKLDRYLDEVIELKARYK